MPNSTQRLPLRRAAPRPLLAAAPTAARSLYSSRLACRRSGHVSSKGWGRQAGRRRGHPAPCPASGRPRRFLLTSGLRPAGVGLQLLPSPPSLLPPPLSPSFSVFLYRPPRQRDSTRSGAPAPRMGARALTWLAAARGGTLPAAVRLLSRRALPAALPPRPSALLSLKTPPPRQRAPHDTNCVREKTTPRVP